MPDGICQRETENRELDKRQRFHRLSCPRAQTRTPRECLEQSTGAGHRAPGTSAYPLAQVQLPQPAESFGEQLLDASPTFHSPGHKAGCWAGIQAVPVGLGADLESRKVRLGQEPGAEWAQPAAGVGPRGQGEVGMRWRVAVQRAEAGMWGKSLFPLSLGVTFCLLVAPGELCFLICERQAVTKPTEWDFREY